MNPAGYAKWAVAIRTALHEALPHTIMRQCDGAKTDKT
jgi:hypothetical protein